MGPVERAPDVPFRLGMRACVAVGDVAVLHAFLDHVALIDE
jgi:hypothetical protein